MNSVIDNSSTAKEDAMSSFKNWIFQLSQPENLRHSWPWTLFFISIYSIIFAVGIIGNFIVIFVFCRRRQMRSVTNMFIVNLAVADLFVILFCLPVTLMTNIYVPWILGTFMCKGVAYIHGISVFASAYSLAVITAARCKGIYRFIPLINHLTKFHALLIIAAIWIVPFVILLPWPIVFEVTPIPENSTVLFCVENWTNESTGNMYFLFGNLLCCYAIPGTIICVANSQVCRRVTHPKTLAGSASSKLVTSHNQRVKLGIKKMLSLVTFTFLLSWLPLYVVMCRVKFTSIELLSETELEVLEVLIPIFQLLGTSNSCENPIFYAYNNSRFREMSRSVFHLPASFSLACFEQYQTRTIRQRYLTEVGNRSRNSSCQCRKSSGNYTTQESISTSSCSITLGSRQCGCQDASQVFEVSREIELYESEQTNASTYFYAKQQIRLMKYSRETSA